ncbi:MAG: hypothetical protein M0R21_13710, partial [Lentimicrobiaceae bacterium]|nr:hypothetical protein [Lentimicrobiaceae bacterium]
DCGSTLAQSMTYNFDTSTYFRKRCLDMMDDQWEDGHFPSQSPEMDGQRSCIWSDAVLTMAWTSWLNYGDKRLLNETFPAVRKYIYLLMSNYEKGTVLWPEHNGDWLSAFMTIRPGAKKWGDLGEGHISKELIQRIDLIYITKLFRDIADVLGKRQDSETAEAFVSKLFSDPIIAGLRDKEPETGAQTAYALSLGWNAAKPDEKPLLMEKLLNAIELKGGHVTTGTISTLPLLNVLSGNGHHELAYRLAMKPEFPSFGFMVDQGATVLWERFDGYIPGMGINPSPMNGLNHVGFAAVSEWIFGSVGGIRPDPLVPGYKHFSIAPRMGGKVTWAKSDYNSVRGKIACDWKVEGATFSMHVVVPPNTTATIYMPTKDVSNVKEGELQLKNASCATFLHVENGCAVFNVESGEYWFSSYL